MAKIVDLDVWVSRFNAAIGKLIIQPYREILEGEFAEWRISYGHSNREGNTYFISFYPAFCTKPKLTFHYMNVAELASDVLAIDKLTEVGMSLSDAIAVSFSILRDKDSVELFKEQKDLMALGLKHFHLDNFYQDTIKGYCKEFYKNKTIRGRAFSLTLFSQIKEKA